MSPSHQSQYANQIAQLAIDGLEKSLAEKSVARQMSNDDESKAVEIYRASVTWAVQYPGQSLVELVKNVTFQFCIRPKNRHKSEFSFT